MNNHFDKYLNVRDLIMKYKPKDVLECGAKDGKNTVLLDGIRKYVPFNLTVITDNDFKMDNVKVLQGVSYKIFPSLEDNSLDMVIIDTDHNYWTLDQELTSIDPKLRNDGLILFHDVSTFYYDTGVATSYASGDGYPLELIESCGKKMGGIGVALIDWLHSKRFGYKMIRYVEESHGGAAIQKSHVDVVSYFKPPEKQYA